MTVTNIFSHPLLTNPLSQSNPDFKHKYVKAKIILVSSSITTKMAYYPPIVRTIHQSQAHHEFPR